MAENGILDYQGMNQAIYRGATSNIVVDTQSMSIEIGAGNSSHTSNLHIECDHDANVASIQLNSNVVTEFPRSKKLIKYPRVALTSAAQSSAGDYEGYIVNQSSVYTSESDHGAYLAFRGNSHWLSSSNSFDGAPDRFNDVNGPWISIQLPTKIKLEYLEFSAASNRIAQLITAGSVYASNNGSTWINIGSLDNLGTYTNTAPAHVNFTHTTLYDRYLLHVTANTTSYNYVHMEKLSLFGIPEYDPEAHGTDVTVKSYPNVPNTDWLEVYYDAKGLATGDVTTVNDLKPSSLGSALNSSSTNNITVADDAFVFNGTDSYIKINDLTNPLGAWVHSVVAWVKFTDFDSSCEVSWIGDADGSAIRQSFSFQAGGETVTMGISGSNVQLRFTSPLTAGKWHHVVYTYNGGQAGSASTAYQVFIDGVEASKFGGVGSGTLTLPAGSAIWLGRNHSGTNQFGGSIANYRLFNRALTSNEIYQLYAYQKEDFGHSTNNMTLKAGRLGIGTSEPRAALDVKGDVKFSGMPNMTESIFFYIDGSAGDNYPKYQNTHEYYQNKFIPPGIGSYGVDAQWYTTSSYTSNNDLFKSHFDTMVYWLKNAPIGHVHKLNWVTDNTSCNGTTFGQKNNGTQIRLWGYFPAYNTGYSYGNNKQWNDALIFNMSSATELLIFYDGYTISN